MRIRSVDGFTLVEVLVAALVLAIGVIGVAATHISSVRTRHDTALTSGGVQLASALADRMRANAAQMQSGDALNPYLQLRYDVQSDGPPAPVAVMCHVAAWCTGAQMAAFDIYEIKRALHAAYPAARVTVCRDSPSGGSGPLAWECSGGAQAPIVIKLGWLAPGAEAAQVAPSVVVVVAGAFP